MKRVLTIAGSDSGGGAGIQADLKTFMALGCYGTSAITALTAQNTQGVRGVFPVTPSFVVDQIEAVLEDIGIDAIKIGMLANTPIIEAIAKCLKRYHSIPLVLDPVMISQSGHALLETDAIWALREYLFPRAFLVTPNLDEAYLLVGECEPNIAAQKIASMGPQAVLVKGGHRNSKEYAEAKDHLLYRGREHEYASSWIKTRHTHGTGCTLAAAITAHVAQGFELPQAVGLAKDYLTQALFHGASLQIGHGAGPVCHHWKML